MTKRIKQISALYKVAARVEAKRFMLYELSEQDKDDLFEIFKKSYEQSTGQSWSKHTFFGRARGWTFFGDSKDGIVALRKQRSGLWKLTAVAGNPRGIIKGIDLMTREIGSEPIWGAVSDDLVPIAERYGLIAPHKMKGFGLVLKLILSKIPSSVFGGGNLSINSDGSMSIDVVEVGTVSKFFVANKAYFKNLLTSDIGEEIKEKHPIATKVIEKFLNTLI